MSTGPRILIVDDEPNIRDLLTTSLRFAGFAVRAVGNGAQAISAVLEEEPDLIILDVMLPRVDGLAMLADLRQRQVQSNVLVFSATGSRNAERARLLGAAGYLSKPFDLEELLDRVRLLTRRDEVA